MSGTTKLPKKLQSRPLELALLVFSAWGVVGSGRQIATDWNDDDNLERATNVVALVAALLGLIVSIRKFRRGSAS